MARLFISQTQMDRWSGEGKVRLEQDVMTIEALKRSFKIRSAVYFTAVIDGSDSASLLGKVKSDTQLSELGGEHCGTSVLLGDIGYECVEGFLGTPIEGTSDLSGLES